MEPYGFGKASVHGAVNRTVAVACRPRFFGGTVWIDCRGKWKGNKGMPGRNRTQTRTCGALARCLGQTPISSFDRVVSLPPVTPA